MNKILDTVWSMKPNLKLAMQLAKRDLPGLVYDAVNLEGVAMTLPEIQTILDGITVGGHKISDQNMAANQAKAWEYVFSLVNKSDFNTDKKTALEILSIAEKNQPHTKPPEPEDLDSVWNTTIELVNQQDDIYEQAMTLFLQVTRSQFFWDVNKRTGRFMMNGLLLSQGYPIINVPVKRKQEFNTLMLEFYTTNEMRPMFSFLRGCIDERIIQNFKIVR